MVLGSTGVALAQSRNDLFADQAQLVRRHLAARPGPPPDVPGLTPELVGLRDQGPVFGGVRSHSERVRQAAPRSKTAAVLGGIVGGVGGFFAGGYLGAAIEGDRCHCDDPGLMGALIGAPIGGAVGAVLGTLYLF
jgi:hypothetical protein